MRVHRIRDRATTRGMLRALDTILIIKDTALLMPCQPLRQAAVAIHGAAAPHHARHRRPAHLLAGGRIIRRRRLATHDIGAEPDDAPLRALRASTRRQQQTLLAVDVALRKELILSLARGLALRLLLLLLLPLCLLGRQRCKRKCMSPLQSVQCVGPRGGDVGLQNPDFRILPPLNGRSGGVKG